jgi:hypothetical protein
VVAGPAQEVTVRVPMNGGIAGLVVDGLTQDPISGANVNIRGRYAYQGNAMRDFSVAKAFSNPPGEFLFSSIPPGTYTVTVTAPNYLPFTLGDIDVPSPGLVTLPKIILDSGGIMKGRVVAADTGETITGATVKLTPSGATGRSNAQGVFTISGLEPNVYNLRAEHTQYLPTGKNIIQVTRGDETDVGDIVMDRGAVILGQVTDGAGNPIEGATISVRHTALDRTRVVRTDRAGNYRLTGLEAGGVTISVTANFPRGPATKTHSAQLSLVTELRHDVVLSGRLRFTGIVRGPLGANLMNPRIEVYPMEPDDRPVSRGKIIASVSNGSFEIENMIEGRYLVIGSGQWGSQFIRWHRVVYVSPPGTNAAIIAPNGTIQGRVARQATGALVPDRTVLVRGLSFPHSNMSAFSNYWTYQTKTDSGGSFSVSALPAGRYEVIAYDDASRMHRTEVNLNTENGTITANVGIP